jgi:hypothetical protein
MDNVTPLEVVYSLIQAPVSAIARGNAALNDKDFQKYPGIRHALVTTGTIVTDKNGWKAGDKWDSWMAFLISEHHRLRHLKRGRAAAQQDTVRQEEGESPSGRVTSYPGTTRRGYAPLFA